MTPTAIVLKGYPRLSETFIAQEIRALEAAGLPICIVSLRRPTDTARHPVHREIEARVLYLPEYLWREPGRVWRAWRRARRLPGYGAARKAWLSDLWRDPTPSRMRRFGQALMLAAELDPVYRHLHAHFLHTPGSVARYAAAALGVGWSASAHAVDIYTTPDREIAAKIESADWVVTCTAANRDYLRRRSSHPEKVDLVYHGLDLSRFPLPPADPGRSGPVRILCVSRLVEKKGVDDVLRALARLPRNLDWRFTHIGGSEMPKHIKKVIQRFDIEEKIEFIKAVSQDDLLTHYRRADVFVLASRVARDGDRDGLPNVLMEAQSQNLPCISTRVSAIPELIRDGETGLLVEPGDIDGLADALAKLIGDADLRRRLGDAGGLRVRRDFEFFRCIEKLLPKFGLRTGLPVDKVA